MSFSLNNLHGDYVDCIFLVEPEIMSFPFICTNISSAPADGVCTLFDISELMVPVMISLIEGYIYRGILSTNVSECLYLKSSLNLENRYGISVSQQNTYIFRLSHPQSIRFLINGSLTRITAVEQE